MGAIIRALVVVLVFIWTARGHAAGGPEASLKAAVQGYLDALRAKDQAKAKERLSKLFPTQQDMVAVFAEKGDRLWQRLQRSYSPSDRYLASLIRRYAAMGVPSIAEAINIRTEPAGKWTYSRIAKIVPEQYPAYRVTLRSPGRRRGESWSTFIRVNDRWVWFKSVEAAALAEYKDVGAAPTDVATAQPSKAPDPRISEFVKQLGDKEASVRNSAARALGRMYEKGKDAVPALIKAINDEDLSVRQSVHAALRNIGKAAGPALIQALEDKEVGVRQSAARILADMKHKPEDVVPAFAKALKDEDRAVRSYAIRGLSRSVGPESAPLVPLLLEALRTGDAGDRSSAAMALGRIGPAAKEALPAVMEALSDKTRYVRTAAVYATRSICTDAKVVVPALVRMLNDEHQTVLRAAARGLGELGPLAKDAIPALEKALNGADRSAQRTIQIALQRIRRQGKK